VFLGGSEREILGNRIRFKEEIEEGLNFCTDPPTVHPQARALGVLCGLLLISVDLLITKIKS